VYHRGFFPYHQTNHLEDGGGIRGYSSLLIIEELMKIVGTIETRHSPNVTSSYHPEEFIPSKGYLEDSLPMPTVRYLPAHYFDYIGERSAYLATTNQPRKLTL